LNIKITTRREEGPSAAWVVWAMAVALGGGRLLLWSEKGSRKVEGGNRNVSLRVRGVRENKRGGCVADH